MKMLFAVGVSVPIKCFNPDKASLTKTIDAKLLRSGACRVTHWQLLDTAKPESQGSLANENVLGAHSGDAKTTACQVAVSQGLSS
jgi:hypothetical protein